MARRLPCSSRMTRIGALTLTLLFLPVATSSIAIAADSIPDGPRRPIRTTDDRLRKLLDEGMRTSPTFRALVERLHASDVVVYLRCDRVSPRAADGRLTFLSSAGGLRYVVVRMTHLQAPERQIAIIAHELRHAIEIADAPQIVDGPSLVREYKRIGYVSLGSKLPGITFDSKAAVDAGIQVMRELMDYGDE
jgi:hypothetical protein